MNFAFRVDSSAEIGTGHLGRCFTLAEKIVNAGHYVLFICRHVPSNSVEMIKKSGCKLLKLDSQGDCATQGDLSHSSWLGVEQSKDAIQCIEGLDSLDIKLDWLIIDHYALDFRWEKQLSLCTNNICVIDDLADRKHHCDLLVDQNFYNNPKSRYRHLVPPNCMLLLGPKYAILRDQFKNIKTSINNHDGKIKRIVIFFGGSDVNNFTGKAIHALGNLSLDDVSVDVIIGELHPDKQMIQRQCEKFKFVLYIQTSCIEAIFSASDLCIGGGGVSTWERCCLGLPTMIVAIAMNQIQIAKDLHDENGCIYLGDSLSVTEEIIQSKLEELFANPSEVKDISQNAYNLVDGLGAKRVLSILSNCNEHIDSN